MQNLATGIQDFITYRFTAVCGDDNAWQHSDSSIKLVPQENAGRPGIEMIIEKQDIRTLALAFGQRLRGI